MLENEDPIDLKPLKVPERKLERLQAAGGALIPDSAALRGARPRSRETFHASRSRACTYTCAAVPPVVFQVGKLQEVSWEKRRKQRRISAAAGSDPQP